MKQIDDLMPLATLEDLQMLEVRKGEVEKAERICDVYRRRTSLMAEISKF